MSEILAAFRAHVRAREINFSTYHLPPIDEQARATVVQRIVGAETLVSPELTVEGYGNGAATIDNELLIVAGHSPVLLTAEHATDRLRAYEDGRPSRHDAADPGTFGLSRVVRDDTDASLVAAIGRQTGDANHDLEHPLKTAMQAFVEKPEVSAHLSVHRMFRGRVADVCDERAFNIILGIGHRPSDATKDFADKVLAIAKTYDLVAGVNQKTIQFEKDRFTPKRNEDGSMQTITFAAKGPGTTRTYAQQAAEALGKPFITAQIELSSSMLLQPENFPGNPGPESQRIGVYLGYLFLKDCVSSANINFC